jgi:hypothetical protein
MTEREFHIGDILTLMTGRLVSPRHMDGVYEMCDFMSGEANMTHQLPRVMEESAPTLREQFPDLAAIDIPGDLEGETAVYAWLDEQVAIHGETRMVHPLDPADHTSIDPISELRMMRPDMPIIGVVVDEEQR